MSQAVAIDDKSASRWTEDDLRQLCHERRLEGPRLEFKRQLDLDTDQQKAEARRDSIGMATPAQGPGTSSTESTRPIPATARPRPVRSCR